MKPENRKSIAKFLMETKPVAEEGWEETRLVLKWNGHVYVVTDNWPDWTTSQILDFANSIPDVEVTNVTVRVTIDDTEDNL